MNRYFAFLMCSTVFLVGCSSGLSMQRTGSGIENRATSLKTIAYAEVNSPKQSGEIYVLKGNTVFGQENGVYKLNLDPQDFKNAYSFVELSFREIKEGKLHDLRVLLQGENFSDAYKTGDLATEKGARLECDGQSARLTVQGIAVSAVNSMQEPVDLQVVFPLTELFTKACP